MATKQLLLAIHPYIGFLSKFIRTEYRNDHICNTLYTGIVRIEFSAITSIGRSYTMTCLVFGEIYFNMLIQTISP
jgi:hypothetical protein